MALVGYDRWASTFEWALTWAAEQQIVDRRGQSEEVCAAKMIADALHGYDYGGSALTQLAESVFRRNLTRRFVSFTTEDTGRTLGNLRRAIDAGKTLARQVEREETATARFCALNQESQNMSEQKIEKIEPKKSKVLAVCEDAAAEAKAGALQGAAQSFAEKARDVVVSRLEKATVAEAFARGFAVFLMTAWGLAAWSLFLGIVLPYVAAMVPRYGKDPKVAVMAKQLRINGFAGAFSGVANSILGLLKDAFEIMREIGKDPPDGIGE